MTTLSLQHVTVAGRTGDRLRSVDLTFEPGQTCLLVGPNGAGKSTLLRVLLGLEVMSEGSARIGGHNVRDLSARGRAAAVAWLPQNPRLEVGVTGEELVAAARFRFQEPWREARAVARDMLRARGAHAFADRRMETLSGGEAQRVRFAALDAQEASWWLLDEPAAHLDPSIQLTLLEAVRAREEQDGGVIMVTHDLAMVPSFFSKQARVVGLSGGAVAVDEPLQPSVSVRSIGRLMSLELAEITVEDRPHWVVQGAAP